MHQDHHKIFAYTSKARVDKAINNLLGLLQGILIDQQINSLEMDYLRNWVSDHEMYRNKHPFSELISTIETSTSDGVLTTEEIKDLEWLCQKFHSNEYYDVITTDLQQLHHILGGIVSDGTVSKEEIIGLTDWLESHDHLKACWPYDEIESVITKVMADGVIDEEEQSLLKDLFCEFVVTHGENTIKSAPLLVNSKLKGICSVCPQIEFDDSVFCFTGASKKLTRKQFQQIVLDKGGSVSESVNKSLTYLIVGADGNPCWAFACYGRKVEQAVGYRKQGHKIQIVHELDFHDSL